MTIKKLDGATDLVANDIKNGQIVEVEYDGTNFQMLTPSSSPQSVISALINSGAQSSAVNVDTVITANFKVQTITVYYALQGSTSGANRFSNGIATYKSDGTLISNLILAANQANQSSFGSSDLLATTPTAGTLVANDVRVDLRRR